MSNLWVYIWLFSCSRLYPMGLLKKHTHILIYSQVLTPTRPPLPPLPHPHIQSYIHTHIHTYIYIHKHVRTHTYTHTHTHTRKQTMHTHRYIYTRTSAHRDLNRESFYKFPGFFFWIRWVSTRFQPKLVLITAEHWQSAGVGKWGYWFTDIPLLLAKQGMLNKVHLCHWCRCPDAHSYANYILTFQAVISFLSSVCW